MEPFLKMAPALLVGGGFVACSGSYSKQLNGFMPIFACGGYSSSGADSLRDGHHLLVERVCFSRTVFIIALLFQLVLLDLAGIALAPEMWIHGQKNCW